MEQEIMNNIDQTPFFSNEQTINHYPDKFIIDFTYSHHQFVKGTGINILNHKVMILDPWVVKTFLDALTTNVKKYEETFGEIKKPESISIAEEKYKKNIITPTKSQEYFG